MKRYTSVIILLGLAIALFPLKCLSQSRLRKDFEAYPAFSSVECDRFLGEWEAFKQNTSSESLQKNTDLFRIGTWLEECEQLKAATEVYQASAALDKQSMRYTHQIARIYAKQQRFDDAVHLKRQFLREDFRYQTLDSEKQDAWVYDETGRLCVEAQQFTEAQSFFEQAIQSDPDRLSAYENLGKLLVQRQQLQAAVNAFQAGSKQGNPKAPASQHLAHAYFWVGLTLDTKGNRASAIEWLTKAIDIAPTHEASYRKLSELHGKEKDYEQAIATLEKFQTLQPSNSSILHQIALIYLDKRDDAMAIEAMEQSLTPEMRQHLKSPDAHIQTILGNELMKRARYEDAAQAFETASQWVSDDMGLVSEKGQALMKLRQWDGAIQAYEQIQAFFEANPSNPDIVLRHQTPYHLAEAYIQADRPGDAKAILTPLLDQDAENPKLYLALGRVETLAGNPAESLRQFQMAMKTGGAEFVYQGRFATDEAMIYAAQGKAHQSMGNHATAIEFFQKAIALDPKFALAYRDLGQSLREHKQVDQAVEAYQRAIQLRPRSGLMTYEFYSGLGLSFLALNQLEQAHDAFQNVLAGSKMIVEAQYGLGRVLRAQDKPQEAIAAFEKVLELEPHHAAAQADLQSMKQMLESFSPSPQIGYRKIHSS